VLFKVGDIMKLFIVESPNKCNKLRGFLGSDYKVTASVGHIREIPKKGINVDIKNGFVPTFQVSNDKKGVVKELKELAEEASEIILATDPDREGEAIAWHIYDIFSEKNKKKCKRVTFQEITKKAVLDAIANARDINMQLVDAAKARQVLDRLIGYKVSPILWYSAHINKSSAGRVQSIALKLVCDRQKEIDAFKPEDYWFIEALMKCKNGEFWTKVVTKEKENKYLNEKVAQDDLEKLQKASFVLDKVDRAEKKNNPYPPFDTNSLQVTCSNIFGWSLSKSQVIAQKLYEQGKVTYIRSDSFNIAEEAIKEVRDFIKGKESSPYLPSTANVYTKKSSAAAQEAHECIRPTHVNDEGDDIGEETEKKMYKLIRDRFIACQMTPQIVDTVSYDVKASTDHHLIAKGQTIKFDGWSKAYKYSKTKEEILPSAQEKESLDLKEIKKTKHSTQPPARYNEGSLAKMMEKEGVGRPSTRAAIITSIQKKGYVEKEKKSRGLIAAPLGLQICDYLQPNFKDFFMDIKYTARLEEDIDEITQGKKSYVDVVGAVYEVLQKHIKTSGESIENKKEAKSMGKKCKVCKEGEIVERDGRFGKFYACDKYPTCKTVYEATEDGDFKIKERKAVKTTGKKCPECEKSGRDGELIERKNKSSGNSFYGCSKYPACKYSSPLEGESSSGKKTYAKKTVKKEEEPDTDELDLSIDGDEDK
jgi:DNA topoisomerase-1